MLIRRYDNNQRSDRLTVTRPVHSILLPSEALTARADRAVRPHARLRRCCADHRPSPGTHIAQPTAGIAGDPHVLLRRPPAWRSEAGLDARRAVGVRAAHRRNGMQPKTGYD